MKIHNVIWSKWMRRVSSLMAVLMLFLSFAGQASARILFQDDDFHDIDSEGLIINADDGGDEDVTLKLGNDGTDATITFDDGTGNVTFATDGGDFSFSDDNITTTGDLSATDITGTGVIDFSGATRMAMDQGGSNPGTCTEGDLFYNTTDDTTYVCTATNTWTALSTGGADTFESVYAADGDNTLTTSDGPFTIARGSGAFAISGTGSIDIDGGATTVDVSTLSIDSTDTTNLTMTANDAGAKTLTISAINAGGGTGNLDVDVDDAVTIDSTNAGISLDGAAASNFTTSSGALTLDGAGGVNVAGNAAEVDVTTTGAVDINSGAFTLDGSTVSVDGTDDTNLTMTANDGATKTLTIQATNAGAGTGVLDVNVDDAITIDSTNAGVSIDGAGASNFTTSSGALTLDGNGGVNIAGNAAEVDVTTSGALDFNSGAFTWDGSTAVMTSTSTFDIDSTGAVTIDSDAGSTLSGAGVSLTSDGGALVLTGDGTNDIDLSNSGAAIDVDSATMDITTTSTFAIDTSAWDITGAGAASGFTTIDASGDITTSAGDFIIGTTGLTETTGATDSGAYLVGVFDEFDNSASANVQDVLDDFDALIGSNAPNVEDLTFQAEYPDTVVYQDGSNNKGKLESLYDSSNNVNYYRWTSQQAGAQDIDLRFQFVLPTDFGTVGNLTYQYRTNTTTEANNDVEIRFYNVTNGMTLCDSDTTNGTANVWATNTLTAIAATCTGGTALDPGDVVEVAIQLQANNTANAAADVGYVSLAYTN